MNCDELRFNVPFNISAQPAVFFVQSKVEFMGIRMTEPDQLQQ